MSKDMLGSVVRAAVGVPQRRLDLLAKIASKLAGDNPDGDAWHTHFDEAVENGLPFLTLVKRVTLGELPAMKTAECLKGEYWKYRDVYINRFLPENQPAQAAGFIGVYGLNRMAGTTFREMALAVLKIDVATSNGDLATMLKKRELTLTLPTLDHMVKRQEAGEDIGLRADGYANLAFVEEENSSVSVLCVRRHVDGWNGDVLRLGRGSRWNAGCRLLLRNSDTLTL